jgi:hypothetical protein
MDYALATRQNSFTLDKHLIIYFNSYLSQTPTPVPAPPSFLLLQESQWKQAISYNQTDSSFTLRFKLSGVPEIIHGQPLPPFFK